MTDAIDGYRKYWFNQDGGIVLDLDDNEAKAYAQNGYIVEELN